MRFLQNQGHRTYVKIDGKNDAKMRVPTNRKIGAKREAKSHHCRRRALTAAPLGETGESSLVVRYLGNGEAAEKVSKRHRK